MTNPMQHLSGRRDARGHGGGVRGADLARRSPLFEGRFGRMFRTLPAAVFTDAELSNLAKAMTAKAESIEIGSKAVRSATAEALPDDEENFGIPAGYTYFGQFVDHDLTFDPVSSLQGQNDPDGLVDFRTPRFDLDSLYGRGPDDEPYMYQTDGKSLMLGRDLTRNDVSNTPRAYDLPRAKNERAIIGDKRNDENVIVSQLHGLFIRFHNLVVQENPKLAFSDIQQIVRWHYQWAVLHDYLPRIVGDAMVASILPHLAQKKSPLEVHPKLHFFHPKENAFIPIEFTVAAYRFGHSMVRPIYRLSKEMGLDESKPDDETNPHTAGRLLIFAAEGLKGLNGFREFPSQWAIDWSLFFETEKPLSLDDTLTNGAGRVQPAYKIDTSLVNPLDFLPEFCKTKPGSQDLEMSGQFPAVQTDPLTNLPEIPNLAHRNLLRGRSMGLPSGQAVAKAMGLVPLRDEEIVLGKAIMDDTFADPGKRAENESILKHGQGFRGNAPLWVYILAEAQHGWTTAAQGQAQAKGQARDRANAIPVHLGPVGGRIVAETIIGLMLSDSFSFLSQEPGWKPKPSWCEGGKFGMPQLIKAALSWSPPPL